MFCDDPPGRRAERLLDLVPAEPNRAYDVRGVVEEVVDDGRYLEVHESWAGNVVCAFARLDGRPVGIVANQPAVLAGALDIAAAQKAARFVQLCDAFHLPLVAFLDVPGFLPGVGQERGGVIRHGAKLLYAYCDASVPRIQVILRKAYGGAYIVMDSRDMGSDLAHVKSWRAEIEKAALSGPHIETCGPLIDGFPSDDPRLPVVMVRSPAEARSTFDLLDDQQVDFIGVRVRLPREAYFALIERARKYYSHVAGPVPSTVSVLEAIDARRVLRLLGRSQCEELEGSLRVVPEQIMNVLVQQSALRKALQPEDLTGTAVFLASADSDLMTGQVLVVDGGMIMLG